METSIQHSMEAAGVCLSERVDVLIVSKREAQAQITSLLSNRQVSFANVTVKQAGAALDTPEFIGTVIIDASGMSLTEQKALKGLIGDFEKQDIAVVLLNSWADLSNSNFSLLQTLYTSTLEELWGRVQANLGYRRKCGYKASSNSESSAAADAVIEQLKMAGKVQRDFLPAQLPASDKLTWQTIFEPAEWVSGDIYDAARLDEKHVGFYIADAVGHSLPAALLTMFIKQAMVMRETVGKTYRIFEPAEVVSNLNNRMAGQGLSGCQFATCCYCLLDTETLELKFARGGHPYPILVRGGKMEQLLVRGPLVGVFEGAEYLQETRQLQSGDKVLLYSDGLEPVIGKMEASGFKFTPEFAALGDLPLSEMAGRIKELVKGHKFREAELDDVTIVGLEIK